MPGRSVVPIILRLTPVPNTQGNVGRQRRPRRCVFFPRCTRFCAVRGAQNSIRTDRLVFISPFFFHRTRLIRLVRRRRM